MLSLSEAVAEFLLSCQADGLRPATVKWYRHMLANMGRGLGERVLNEITVNDVREHVLALRMRESRYADAPQRPKVAGGLSNESIRDHLCAMRRFWLWAVAEYELVANPMTRIKIPRRQQREPKAIDLDDLRSMMHACEDRSQGERDRAILAFLTDTGCRAGGLLSLQIPDAHLGELYAVVREKGDRARAVPFTPYTASLLSRWLEVRPATDHQYVFVSLGSVSSGRPLTLSGLHMMLRRLKAKAGVSGRVNPHSFRHGFARQYLLAGGDLATLAQIMGHSDVSVTTSNYAIYTRAELARQHARFSPIHLVNGDGDE